MLFHTPKFWYKTGLNLYAFLLTPLSWLYQLGHRLNQKMKGAPYRSRLPVICIGNAIAGGSGKTPAAIALLNILKENGIANNPYFLSRGYGGTIKGPLIVDPSRHRYTDVGDEPLLLCRHAPTIVSANRAAGAKLAETSGADCIIMDDGLQNNSLCKDLSFLVIDRQMDFGNGKTIPAGPLREPLSRLLPKVSAILCVGRPLQSELPVFEALIKASKIPNPRYTYMAFAGIGWPEKFKYSLDDLDVKLKGWRAFPDHHPYTPEDIIALKEEATRKNVTLITTEKDFLRLPVNFSYDIKTLPIKMSFIEKDELISFVEKKMTERS